MAGQTCSSIGMRFAIPIKKKATKIFTYTAEEYRSSWWSQWVCHWNYNKWRRDPSEERQQWKEHDKHWKTSKTTNITRRNNSYFKFILTILIGRINRREGQGLGGLVLHHINQRAQNSDIQLSSFRSLEERIFINHTANAHNDGLNRSNSYQIYTFIINSSLT